MSRGDYVHGHFDKADRRIRIVHSPSGATLGTIEAGRYADGGGTAYIARDFHGNDLGNADTLYRAVEFVSEGPTGTGTPYAD